MKLDFLICGSPTDGFFSQIAFFRLCLNHLGGDYASARLVATFGDHTEEAVPAKWQRYFDQVEVEWSHPVGAENIQYSAQHNRRFAMMRPDADLVVLCDADVAILSPFDTLARELIAAPALAGVIAHYHFPNPMRRESPDAEWAEIATAVIGRDIERPYRYMLYDEATAPAAPFYINYGVFIGTPQLLTAFNERERQLRPKTAEFVGDWWAPQVCLALTCVDLGLPTRALPIRYNFPNDPIADQRYPEDMENITFLHYLRTDKLRRDQIFADEDKFYGFLRGEFTGSNEVFRRHVEKVTNGIYPFAQ